MTRCQATTQRGAPCQAAAGADGFCFAHSPKHGRRVAEGRRLGGMRARVPTSGADLVQIGDVADVLRVINVAVADTWLLPNSPARARVLLRAAEVALKALGVGELEQRVEALEALVSGLRAPINGANGRQYERA